MGLVRKILIYAFLCFVAFVAVQAQAALISHYRPTFTPVFTKMGELKIAIRYFKKNNDDYSLIVDPYNFTTELSPLKELFHRDPNLDSPKKVGYLQWETIKNTPYLKSLANYSKYPGSIQNAGLKHADNEQDGFFLTVDLCPSVRPFEKDFFQRLVELGERDKRPFPVAIAITGLWLSSHNDEFNWLLSMQKAGKLDITWVNHSYNHLYFSDVPYKDNFLNFQNTYIDDEILSTEIALIERNQLPSVFFRLPGLVASESLLTQLKNYSLIPLGADAWIAKKELPRDGSIILVHGNGNEHLGIVEVMPYLSQQNKYTWNPILKALPYI